MNVKKRLSRENLKTILIIALLLAVLALLAVIVFRAPQTKVVYQTTPTSQNSERSKKSDVSPYVANEVRNTIAKKWKEMNECYNKFLESTPTPKITEGVISVDWQVDADGEVISPEIVTSQIHHPVLEQCLISKIKSWRFPPPPPTGRNAYVLYKFNFKKTE